jgi:hypothetical protein
MRSSTARALLALILLTVALEAVPTEQQATVLQPLTLTATFNIEPGDAVAPHIYDWYFDGVDDYVRVPNNPSLIIPNEITVIAWAQYYRTNFGVTIVGKGTFNRGFAITATPNDVFFSVANDNIVERRWVSNGDMSGLMAFYAGVSRLGYTALYVNDNLYGPLRNTIPPYINNTYDLYVGGRGFWGPAGMYRGYISMAMLYTRALSSSEIAWVYNANIVSANGLVLFLDATFYNGTRYVDLSGRGNHGVGYGGVSRVLSSRPHLYLVKGLHGDGLVHFRFFPVNTVVDVYNATTNSLVASFTIDGPANPAGLVEDYAVSLGPGLYRLAVYTTVYVQVVRPALPVSKLVVAHFKAEMGPGCRVYIDYTAWPKAEPRAECGLQTGVVFLTGLPAGATVRVWNETVLYEVTASSTGVAVLGGLKPGAYEVKVYSDTLSIPHVHLLRLDPLSGLRQFFGFWDRLTFNLFTPVFVVGLVLAVYLRTWSAVLTALVALAAHIVIAPDNIWIRGLLALALAVAVYIAVWRRTTLI